MDVISKNNKKIIFKKIPFIVVGGGILFVCFLSVCFWCCFTAQFFLKLVGLEVRAITRPV